MAKHLWWHETCLEKYAPGLGKRELRPFPLRSKKESQTHPSDCLYYVLWRAIALLFWATQTSCFLFALFYVLQEIWHLYMKKKNLPSPLTMNQFSSVQSFSHVWPFATPWTAARQASLSITNTWSPPKPMSIELVMPSNHLILCCSLLLLPSIFPRIRVFSNESALHIRWPKHWSFSFNISPSNEHLGLMSFKY